MTKQSKKTIPLLRRAIGAGAFWLLLSQVNLGWALDGADNWRNLSPKERENVLRNYQRWQNLPPQDKEHLRGEWERWRNLPPEQRDKLRKRYDELHKLPPQEQRQWRDQSSGKKSRRPKDRSDE